jgi:hypothetical protein
MIQHALQPPIPFLSHAPVIDGVLTPDKAQLPARRFAHTFKMDPGNPDFDLCYRLAYGTDYLYLYIQVDAETFICRDRRDGCVFPGRRRAARYWAASLDPLGRILLDLCV